jgi:histidyl-tRNA synthetase
MIPDAEILKITQEIMHGLKLDQEIKIVINHRKILDGLFVVCGVPQEKVRTISSSVDKLDKMPWEAVKKEMLDKGITDLVADQIGEYVKHNGTITDMLKVLNADEKLTSNADVKAGLDDMALLATYLDALGVSKISFDLSLARGLDYVCCSNKFLIQ